MGEDFNRLVWRYLQEAMNQSLSRPPQLPPNMPFETDLASELRSPARPLVTSFLVALLVLTLDATAPAKAQSQISQAPNSQTIAAPRATPEVHSGVVLKYGVPHEIRYRVRNGRAIYQGDVDLGAVEEMERLSAQFTDRSVTYAQVAKDTRWPGAVVPYVIESNKLSSAHIDAINLAIRHFQERTVLRFVQRRRQASYIVFTGSNDDGSCGLSTGIGRQGSQTHGYTGFPQFIKLRCADQRTSIHEMGHAIGLFHEHTRCDRDDYININWPNVDDPDQFYRECALAWWKDIYRPDSYRSGPYDYASVMHYGRFASAKDDSQPTIVAPRQIGLNSLSSGDIEAINALYVNWSPNVRLQSLSSERSPTVIAFDYALHVIYVDDDGFINHAIKEGTSLSKLGRIKNRNGREFHASTSAVNATAHRGKLYVAFSGHNREPSVVALRSGERTWNEAASVSRPTGRGTSSRVVTYDAPAITSFLDRLWLVYRNDDSADIYYTYLRDNGLFAAPLPVPAKSRKAPALATFDGRIHLALVGNTPTGLLYHSTFDGTLWSPSRKMSGKYSWTSPALATFDNRLHMIHGGGPIQTGFGQSLPNTGLWYTFFGTDGTWRPDVEIADQRSKARVALGGLGNCLHMIHLGKSSDDMWHSTLFSLDNPNASLKCE
ncbi:MAG: M12 family metallopeptidase [Burkholderiales bacterium]